MNTVYSVIKQPIVHFLILGALLFAVHQWLNPQLGQTDESAISINEASVIAYMQYQKPALSRSDAQGQWRAFSNDKQQQLVDALIRSEVLYREAKKLQMDISDDVIKRRLIQKMEYLLSGFSPASTPKPSAVNAYYEQHKQRYNRPSTATFTHVFIDPTSLNKYQLKQRLNTLKQQLNATPVQFHEATAFGERFLYHRNYAARNADLISAHFGEVFTQTVLKLKPSNAQWHGPIASEHGWHFVMLRQVSEGGTPALTEVYSHVAQDAEQSLLNQQRDKAIEQLINNYPIINTLK